METEFDESLTEQFGWMFKPVALVAVPLILSVLLLAMTLIIENIFGVAVLHQYQLKGAPSIPPQTGSNESATNNLPKTEIMRELDELGRETDRNLLQKTNKPPESDPNTELKAQSDLEIQELNKHPFYLYQEILMIIMFHMVALCIGLHGADKFRHNFSLLSLAWLHLLILALFIVIIVDTNNRRCAG